jgi:hypothetical protein
LERLQEIRGFKVETKPSQLVVKVEISSGMRVKLQAKSCVVVGKMRLKTNRFATTFLKKKASHLESNLQGL